MSSTATRAPDPPNTGTTISERERASQVMWPGKACTSGTTTVRSSAAGEDGAEQSFAGQYDTVLGVDSTERFVDAVRTCVQSTRSRRASAYGGGAPPAMHLVVQRMVDARAAGVVFTADPTTGRRDLMVIDAVAGLGESLVDGTSSPEHIVLDSCGEVAVHDERPVARLQRQQLADGTRARARTGAQQLELGAARPPGEVLHPAPRPGRQVARRAPGRDGKLRRLGVLDLFERIVEMGELDPLALALLDDRLEPLRALVPPVPEQLSVQRTDNEAVIDLLTELLAVGRSDVPGTPPAPVPDDMPE